MRGEMQWIVFLFWFFSTSHRVVAHVALTFPPARKYDLDFLDNSRTHSPCGMPKSSSVTTLPAGASFNVTWHLAYPHKGGFKLELLDQNERLLTDLTPTTSETNYVGSQDTTAQSYTVTIPKTVSCKGCTIRLLRQAREWGRKYLFWSCGDVDIVPVSEFQTICSGRGKLEEGHCSCNRLYSGNVCQYRDECWSNDDCGLHGKCINLKSTTFPKMQCFCETGWFGEKCDKESSVKTTNLDLSKHFQKNLSDDYTLYWRILQDREEIEVILKVYGTSYVALGWRPLGMNAGCKAFPLIREVRSTPSEPETNDKTTVVECITAAPDTTNIPDDGSKIRPGPHLMSSATLTTEVLKTSNDTTTINPHAGSKTVNPHMSKAKHPSDVDKNRDRKIERVSTSSTVLPKFFKKIFDFEVPTQPNVNFLHMPHSLLSDRFSSQPYYFRSANLPFNQHFQPSWSRNWPSLSQSFERSFGEGGNIIGIPAIDSSQNGAYNRPNFASKNRFKRKIAPSSIKHSFLESAGKYPPKSSYTPRHDFHPMDCTDMVIGAVRRGASRIFDSYTRDRSTPRTDSYYGGTDDLTAAVGYEENGLTTIVFRKKLKGKELTDHTIENSFMDVIWARGQEIGKYIHRPNTGLEDCKVKTPDFYRPDEIKYHGHGKQRGKVTMNFFDANSKPTGMDVLSTGEWKYPQNCKVHSCSYHVKWKLRKNSDEIEFIIYSSNINKWTGIGFSNNTKMTNSDAIIGWVNDIGQVTVIDTWLTDYEHPQYDVKQDIHKFSGEIKDGIFKLQFSRKINTGDDFQDLQFSSQNCLYFLYPVKGGTYNSKTRRINVHEQPPMISTQKICINHISDAEQKPKSELDVKSEPEPTIVTDVQTEFESTSKPVVKPEPETTSESNVKYEPEPTSEPDVKSEPEPRSVSDVKSEFDRSNRPAVKSKPKTSDEEDIKSEIEFNVEQDIKSEPASSDESGFKTGSEPSSEPGIKSDVSTDSTFSPEPTSEPEPVPQPPTQSSIQKEETAENTHEFPSSSTIPHQSVGSSSTSTSTTTIITTKTTPRTAHQEKKYNVQLKLAQPWKNALERVDSDEHRRLREEIINKVSPTLKSIKEFEEIKFDIFKSNDDAENKTVLVRMVVTMLGKKPDENECNLTVHHLSQLNSALSETVSRGYIGDLRVDPAYLTIQPATVANVGSNGDAIDEGTGPMELPAKQDITVYIIVAGFMALLFLIGLQVFVVFWRDRKRRRRTKTDRPKDCQCAACKGLHRKCIRM